MASMNTRLNIKKLDGNIVQKHGGSKQVGFKQLGPGVETGVHGVSNNDTAVAERQLEDKQLEEKTNTDCLVKKQEKEYQTGWKIKTSNVLDSCNQRSTQQCMKSESGLSKVISKWKAELKEDMDIRPDVYVLNKDCRKSSDDSHDYYWEYAPAKENVLGMEIIRDQSSNTLRVSQSRFYNGKLVQTLLEGHSILSLEGSLSRDCDVEKNGKWSCIYAVRSQEYQMVCTRLDITSEDVGMLYKFDHGLQIDVQDFFVDFDYAIGRSITIMGKINHKVRVDDTRMFRKLRIYDAAHEGFINN
ncbi:hypothetical protein Tco_0923359 [Tanacetum coccineum]|uniref:Zinc finger, CCHC-type n=1 Tax=Tanacetum coccineum TaxID=301880 RepID=A0ABQ5D0R4_9ASTR